MKDELLDTLIAVSKDAIDIKLENVQLREENEYLRGQNEAYAKALFGAKRTKKRTNSMNECLLTGNLGADPIVRYSKNETCIANLRLAVNRYMKKGDEVEQITDWFNIVAFGKLGELARDNMKKGTKLLVKGSLQTKKWEKEGVEQHGVEIIAERIEFMGAKPEDE